MNKMLTLQNMMGGEKSLCVQVASDLIAGDTHYVDFRDFTIDAQPFHPQGVIVDCTDASDDCEITITISDFVVQCKKGEVVMLPYPAPVNHSAIIKGGGNTRIYFANYIVMPYSSAVTASGGGGGGGGGGSTMFHGFQGTGAAQGVQNTWTILPLVMSSLDPDGWMTGNKIVVPNGVEIIRVSGMTSAMVMPDGGRPSVSWQIRHGASTSSVLNTGADADLYANQFVDFGAINVVAGEEIALTGLTTSPDLPVLSLTDFIEVLQGDILNT